jgi:hypothetical protein
MVGGASCAQTRNVTSSAHMRLITLRCSFLLHCWGNGDGDGEATWRHRGGGGGGGPSLLAALAVTGWRHGMPSCCRVENTSLELICSAGVEEVPGLSGCR